MWPSDKGHVGLEYVLGVLDQQTCEVLRLFNAPPDFTSYWAAFSHDSARLFVRVSPYSLKYTLEQLSTIDPERAARIAAHKPENPTFIVLGGKGFSEQLASLPIEVVASYESGDNLLVLRYRKGEGMERGEAAEESGWLVLNEDTGTVAFKVLHRDTPSAVLLQDIPLYENGPRAGVTGHRPPDEGEVARLREPIYVDASVLVLQYKTDVRSHGQTVKQRQFLAAWSAPAKKVAITELPDAAENVTVKAAGSKLEVSYSLKAKTDEAAHVTTQQVQLPK